jgi:hypothetical protein
MLFRPGRACADGVVALRLAPPYKLRTLASRRSPQLERRTPQSKVFKHQLPIYESTAKAGDSQVPAALRRRPVRLSRMLGAR